MAIVRCPRIRKDATDNKACRAVKRKGKYIALSYNLWLKFPEVELEKRDIEVQ